MGIGPGQADEAVQSGRQWANISGSSIHPPLQRPLYPQAIKTTQKISFFLTRNTAREIRNLRSTEQVECIQTSKMKLQYWSKFLQHSIIKLKFSSRASQTVPYDIFFFLFLEPFTTTYKNVSNQMFKNSKTKRLHHRDRVMNKEELTRADWPERNEFYWVQKSKDKYLTEMSARVSRRQKKIVTVTKILLKFRHEAHKVEFINQITGCIQMGSFRKNVTQLLTLVPSNV